MASLAAIGRGGKVEVGVAEPGVTRASKPAAQHPTRARCRILPVVASSWEQRTRNGLEVLELGTSGATCTIALHGAQVLSFVPAGESDWLWVSEKARWSVGNALRGGIPICFPWFGPHPTERGFPAHGFARTRVWRLLGVREVAGARVRVVLELESDDQTQPLFPHRFTARATVMVGRELELSLEVENGGDQPFAFEAALHSYFAVSDVASIAVEGLGGSAYIDKVAAGDRRRQAVGPLHIEGEVDRVCASGGRVSLVDPGRPGPLEIQSAGAGSTVVWNPGREKARALADLPPDGFRHFVCLETGNVAEQKGTLPPGGRQALSVVYRRA